MFDFDDDDDCGWGPAREPREVRTPARPMAPATYYSTRREVGPMNSPYEFDED